MAKRRSRSKGPKATGPSTSTTRARSKSFEDKRRDFLKRLKALVSKHRETDYYKRRIIDTSLLSNKETRQRITQNKVTTPKASTKTRTRGNDGRRSAPVIVSSSRQPGTHVGEPVATVARKRMKGRSPVHDRITREFTQIPKEERAHCKERPRNNRGNGGSRNFIPWCTRRK